MATKFQKFLRRTRRQLTEPDYRALRREVKRFFRERGRNTPEEFDGLTPASVAFDLGGYRGDWTARMRALYDCTVHVFEPHPAFAAALAERFAGDPKVIVHPCALGAAAGEMRLSDDADASSAFAAAGATVTGAVCAAADIMATLDGGDVDVAKINIEGGEYEILPHLIETGLIARFRTIAVQFHNFAPDAAARRDAIRAALAGTHRCAWCYDFVWEQWERLPA